MRRGAGVLTGLLVLIAVVAMAYLALWLFRADESLRSHITLAIVLAIPAELAGASLYMRSLSGRAGSLGWRRATAEVAGTLAIIISLLFVESAYVSPQHVGEFLLFSWRAATLVLICVGGMVSAGFGKGSVRATALLAGLATLGLWYALGMSP